MSKILNESKIITKIILAIFILFNINYAKSSKTITDSTIVNILTKKYSKINSYSTNFNEEKFKGKIYYKSPNNYLIEDRNFTTIINDTVTYKTNPSMLQTIISKTDDTYKMYSPMGLLYVLNKKFYFFNYDSINHRYIFKAKDKYALVKSISILFNKKLLPENIIIYTNNDKNIKFKFANQKIDIKIDKNKFKYKKIKNYDEIDIR